MSEARLLAGVGEAVITPPVGLWLVGPVLPSKGVHDDLYARALVLNDGEQSAAAVCLDLCGLDFAFSDAIRARICEQTGTSAVLLNCSHTHSAPFTIPWREPHEQLLRDGQAWREELATKVVHVVVEASRNLRPVSLRAGRVPVQVGMHRRVMTDDGVAMQPNPEGPLAPWVDALSVTTESGEAIAVLFSHAAHPLIVFDGGQMISADYPGFAVAAIRERLGKQTVPMFAQGCCGNVNGEPFGGGFEPAKEAGERLGEAAVSAAVQSEAIAGGARSSGSPRLGLGSLTLQLPFQELPSPEEVEAVLESARRRIVEAEAEGASEAEVWWLRDEVWGLERLLGKARRGEQPAPLRFEINMVSVGQQFCLVAMPHEVFVEYQLWADRESPFDHTMTLAYTNGCEGYVPTDAELALGEVGGYEAGTFPAQSTAALAYGQRPALRPGIEGEIREGIAQLWGLVR